MELRAMDLAEVRNLVKWIDEQQRKERREVATLQKQFAGHQDEMSELIARVKGVEEQRTTIQTHITRLAHMDDQMARLKAEIVHLIEQHDDKRIQSEKEMERLRQVEHQAHTRALAEIRESASPVPRLAEEMDQRRAEDERLSASLGTLQNEFPSIEARLDERIRDVAYLEETQRRDARRIAELQQGLVEAQKRGDDLHAKQLVLEDLMRRNEAKFAQSQQTELERQQRTDHFLEQGRLAEQRRKQQLAQWANELEEFNELMAGYARQYEAAEAQRVEADRAKQQWTELMAENDKRHKQRQLEREQWSKEQQRQHENYMEQFHALQDQQDKAASGIKSLFVLQETYADNFRQLTRIWLEGYESVVPSPTTRKIPG
jgi:chromosome segregation ATPase